MSAIFVKYINPETKPIPDHEIEHNTRRQCL